MNLDEIINEAGYSYLNSMLGSGKKNHGIDLFSYENSRQERLERQIKELEKQIEKEKEEGKASKAEEDASKVEELKKKLDKTDIGSESKDRGTDNVAVLQKINKLKGRICFLMMNYANLTSGVGLNGNSLTNAVKIVKGKKDANGNQELKVVGAPTIEVLQKHYDALKKAVEQLREYEYGSEGKDGYSHGAPRRYFENSLNRSKVLLKALENIKPSEISFDPEDIEVPMRTDAAKVKNGPDIEVNGKKTGERYAKINPLKTDRKGNITSQVWRTKMAEVIGKKRFNAFVFEELEPYIHEFQKYRKDADTALTIKRAEFADLVMPKSYSNKDIRDSVGKNLKELAGLDFVAKDVKEGLSKRIDDAKKTVDSKSKASDFKKLREREKKIDDINTSKDAAKDTAREKDADGYNHATYGAKDAAGKLALRNAIYAKEKTDTEKAKTGNQGWLEAHHIEKINLTKVKKIINGWMEENKGPSESEKRIIKFFGVMPGSSGYGGAGTLIFMHTDNPAPKQFSYEGLYAFKVGKSFMNGDLTLAQEKYVENHAGKNKKDAWKQGVLEALKKLDNGEATVCTEEVTTSYFNY